MVYRLFKDGKFIRSFHEEEIPIVDNKISICNTIYVIRSRNDSGIEGVKDLVCA